MAFRSSMVHVFVARLVAHVYAQLGVFLMCIEACPWSAASDGFGPRRRCDKYVVRMNRCEEVLFI